MERRGNATVNTVFFTEGIFGALDILIGAINHQDGGSIGIIPQSDFTPESFLWSI